MNPIQLQQLQQMQQAQQPQSNYGPVDTAGPLPQGNYPQPMQPMQGGAGQIQAQYAQELARQQAFMRARQQAMQTTNSNGFPGLLAGPAAVGGYLGRQVGNVIGTDAGEVGGALGNALLGGGTNGQQVGTALVNALQNVGQFLTAIGHPMAQQFNQMHGFAPAQPAQSQGPFQGIPGTFVNQPQPIRGGIAPQNGMPQGAMQ